MEVQELNQVSNLFKSTNIKRVAISSLLHYGESKEKNL